MFFENMGYTGFDHMEVVNDASIGLVLLPIQN